MAKSLFKKASRSGRLSLITPPVDAANIIGRNAAEIIADVEDRSQITLTGAMAAYLVVFHIVVHKFSQVWYDDRRGVRIFGWRDYGNIN